MGLFPVVETPIPLSCEFRFFRPVQGPRVSSPRSRTLPVRTHEQVISDRLSLEIILMRSAICQAGPKTVPPLPCMTSMLALRISASTSSLVASGTTSGRVEKTGTWCSPWSPITHACPLISLFLRAIAYRGTVKLPAEADAPPWIHSGLFGEEIVIHVHRVCHRDEHTVIIMEWPAALFRNGQVHTEEVCPRFYRGSLGNRGEISM